MANGTDKKPRAALRLVSNAEDSGVEQPTTSPVQGGQPHGPKPQPKSNLGRFLSAYADAIDRDIQLILDL